MIPDTHIDLIRRPLLAHAATIGPDGHPQNNPVWFGWDGEFLRFSQVTGRSKERNLRRDPRIALSIVDPDYPYRRLEVRGVLDGIEDDSDLHFIDSMAHRYMGLDHYPWHKPEHHRIVMRIRPVTTTTMG
ncbi:MAG TPA: PPOX class F420-dependent oxidoreductase [Acidimicrobiia bacterium]